MIRAILDANVLVSGMLGLRRTTSTPGTILYLWFKRSFELITSDPLITEVERSLSKPFFVGRIDPSDLTLALAALREDAIRTDITTSVSSIATHPEDDLVLAAAISAQAHFLVTGDSMLQRLEHYQSVQIISPRDFLTLLEQTHRT